MNERRINCIGISLGGGSECVQVWVGETPIYIHGTYEEMRAFGREIIAAADRREVSEKHAKELGLGSDGRKASNVA